MGKKLPAKTVYKESFKYITNEVLKLSDEVSGKKGEELRKDNVQWTITVPGISSDAAKQFMREAATEANLDTDCVNIALDSEAAAVFCHNPSSSSDEIPTSKYREGTRYIIIDAGGGKVDMTVHEVSEKGELKEIHAGTGHNLGGNFVNERFFVVLENLFGKDIFQRFKTEKTTDWINLSDEFEETKKTFHPKCATVEINIPKSLVELFEQTNEAELSDCKEETEYSSDIEIDGQKLVINNRLMESLFEKPVQDTIEHVKEILTKIGQVDVIFMVGGFSASPVLQMRIKKEFAGMEIINRDGDAVAAGAVIVGPNPHLITQRVLKKTYGVEASMYYVKGVHPEKRKSEEEGREWVHKLFIKHVEKGQTVTVGEIQKEEYYNPLYKSQPNISFHVYASDEKDPKFTDERCTYIGKVTMDISKIPGDMNREIAVSLTFDESEIKVKAREMKTGREVTSKCNFLG